MAATPVVTATLTPDQVKSLPPPASHPIDFATEIKPLLETSCLKCHGRGKAKGDFAIDTRETFLKPARSGRAVIVGNSAKSYLIELVASFDPDTAMPQKGSKLKAEQISLLRAWIDQGLPWDEGVNLGRLAPANLFPVEVKTFGNNGVDALLAGYFTAHHTTPPKPVEDHVFARRVYLDTIGLLPTPDELTKFTSDTRPDKRTRLVQELLADNVRYAQHWLTFWNDLLRNDYAGTGYLDGGRKQISSWLYSALATNLVFDQFVAQLINPPGEAEGFVKGIVWRGAVNASQTPQMQAAQNISQVFMGVNLKCASCHDSFINDWTLADAYGLASVYADAPLEMVQCDKPTGHMATTKFIYPELGSIDGKQPKAERLRRLAEVITQKKNGRLTRTIVNRLWARFMGRGLVEPVDEMDTAAWHPELLGWLADDLASQGYDLKRTMSVILSSAAYQGVAVNGSEQNREGFVFRGPLVRRMTAEQFRDALTGLTGEGYALPNKELDVTVGLRREQMPSLLTKPLWLAAPAENKTEAPANTVYFRKRLTLAELPDEAVATITADEGCIASVNGIRAGIVKDWTKPAVIGLLPLLKAGPNIITVQVTRADGKSRGNPPRKSPVFVFHARFRSENLEQGNAVTRDAEFISDNSWLASDRRQAGWEELEFDDHTWAPAQVLGEFGMEPWNVWRVEATFAGAFANYGTVRAAMVTADPLTAALGRPNREQVVTTRASSATTLQALELTNGAELSRILQRGAARYTSETEQRNPAELATWFYLKALGRPPAPAERELTAARLASPNQRAAIEDVLWSLTMLPEFQLIY